MLLKESPWHLGLKKLSAEKRIKPTVPKTPALAALTGCIVWMGCLSQGQTCFILLYF